jgi:hypothetical protein
MRVWAAGGGLIAAKAGIDTALERWEAAIKARAEGWTALEDRRAAFVGSR